MQYTLCVEGLEIEVTPKNIRSLRLSVRAPEGHVRLSVPRALRPEDLQAFVISRLDWIRKQQQKFLTRGHQPRLHYVEGETHYLWGKPCVLKVVERKGVPRVMLQDAVLWLGVRPGTTEHKRKAVLDAWYREQLFSTLPVLIERYEQCLQVSAKGFGIKKMKTRWGTCNVRTHHVWFSLELAKQSIASLEYVVVHELVHLLEASHNARFKSLMDTFMPDWRSRKAMLNRRT